MGQVESDLIHAQKYLHIEPTGELDSFTEAAIRNFQLKHGLDPSGLLNLETKELMVIGEIDLSTDLSERYDDFIIDYYLPKGEYVEYPTNKEYLFIHHTAGWNNPYRTIDMWGNDTRGRIGTQYVIGGVNPKTEDDSYDGVILKCFDDEYYAWHLGNVDRYMHKHSIGIELCNFGWVTKRGNHFYTYTNSKIHPDQVVDLGYKFRGHRYWHKYSNKQLDALRMLITHITNIHGISTYLGLQERLNHMSPSDAFDYYPQAKHGEVKGILSHTSVRTDKYDTFPQPELVDILMGI